MQSRNAIIVELEDTIVELQHTIRELRHEVAGWKAKYLNEKELRNCDRLRCSR